MAVVHVQPIHAREGEQDIDGHKRYVRTYQVLTDDPADGAAAVRDAAGVPAYGDALDTDPDAFVIEKHANQGDENNLQNWLVAVTYAGRGDPASEPPDVQWSTTKFQKVVQKDANGLVIANSAGDPFEAGLPKDASRFQVSIVKNVIAWDPAEAAGFLDTTNAVPFLLAEHPPGLPVGTCKLSSIGATAVWLSDRSAVQFWKRTTVVEVDLGGWDAEPLDAGFQALVGPGGVFKGKIILRDGTTPSTPQPLDGAGGKLPVGDDPVFCDGLFLRPGPFVLYPPADWSPLNLGY